MPCSLPHTRISRATLLCANASSTRDFESKRSKLEQELVPKLEELAASANGLKAYATRNRCYRVILALDSEHKGARRGLKYRRKAGQWIPASSQRTAKDAESKRVAELVTATEDLIALYLQTMLPLIESYSDELGPLEVERAYRSILAFDPNNSDVRALLGEVKLGDQWIMLETARAIDRREFLLGVAKQAYDSISDLRAVEAEGFELEVGLDWTVVLRTPRVRCLGTGTAEEIERILRASHAMDDLIEATFKRRIALSKHHEIFVLANPGEKETLLKSLPRARKETSNVLEGANGGWLGHGDRFGIWSESVQRRVDGATRSTVNQYLQNGFKVGLRQGWASEGIGVYLVETMVGTHLTWFTKTERYVIQNNGGKAAMTIDNPELDWMEAGRELLTSDGAPRLGALLGRRVSTMSASDLLHSYVLAAYLIEGRADELPFLLEAIGKNGNPTKAFESVLGQKLPIIEARLRRWVVERGQFVEQRESSAE